MAVASRRRWRGPSCCCDGGPCEGLGGGVSWESKLVVRREDSGKTQTNLLGSKFNSGMVFSLFEHNPRSVFFVVFLKYPPSR